MKATQRIRGLDGLSRRLADRALPPAVEAAAAGAARALAADIAAETGASPVLAGTPGRPVVRIADAALAARVRGGPGRPGDPVLDRIRLMAARRGRGA